MGLAQTEQQRNKDVVLRFFQYLENGDTDAAVGLFANEGTFWSPSTRKAYTAAQLQSALQWVTASWKRR